MFRLTCGCKLNLTVLDGPWPPGSPHHPPDLDLLPSRVQHSRFSLCFHSLSRLDERGKVLAATPCIAPSGTRCPMLRKSYLHGGGLTTNNSHALSRFSSSVCPAHLHVTPCAWSYSHRGTTHSMRESCSSMTVRNEI